MMSYPTERLFSSGKPSVGFRARALRVAVVALVACVLMSATRPVFAQEAAQDSDATYRRTGRIS